MRLIADVERRWREMNGLYSELYSEAREKIKPFKNLVAYLNLISSESEALTPSYKI